MDEQVRAEQLLRDLQDIDFIQLGLVIVGTLVLIGLIRRSFPYLAERGPSRLRHYLLGMIPVLRLVLVVASIIWVVPMVFEVTLRNFIVIFGAASVAIGFAFKDYVSSIVAGVVAIFERPYRPGDWVRIGPDQGEVVAVGLRAVKIRTPDGVMVTIPHGEIWGSNIANANDGQRTMMCVADFYLDPNQDDSQLDRLLHDVALTSAYLSYQHPIAVHKASYDMGTHYRLEAYPFDLRDQAAFVSDMTGRGKRVLQELGLKQVTR